MKIFCDYHHAGLYKAICLLFEKRLGHEVYRPIGLEWATNEIWQYSEMLAVQRQYLDFVGMTDTGKGHYTTFENSEKINHKLVTYDQFMDQDWDIILGTVSQHELPFKYLQNRFKPKAKFVRLAGNSGEPFDWELTRNLIDTTGLYPPPAGVNYVKIHQEFDEDVFNYNGPGDPKKIRTYVNCFNESPHWAEYQEIRKQLQDFEWKEHGHHGADGFLVPVDNLAQSMKEAGFILHIKSHGEGYGHIIHNAFACGRPVITVKKYYEGKMAEPLIVDGKTAICLDGLSPQDSAKKIRQYTSPEVYKTLCENASRAFHDNVSFAMDAKKVEEFLNMLI